ncbi:MAG: hypothetical protein FDZ75_01125, partial [Actinobacteria bacterium]
MHRRTIAARAAAVALAALLALPAAASAAPWSVDTSQRTAEQVRARWQGARPVFSANPYVVRPLWSGTFATGTLATGFVADGLGTLNFARYLA